MHFVWENRYWRTAWVCLLLAGVTLAIYWPVGEYDFVQYDDPEYVFENDTVAGGLTWYGFFWSFADAHAANWHPVTWLSHMLDCELFGMTPGAHHLVNVLLHCVNALLVFLVLRSLTSAFWRSGLVAALFAWHPLRVESVAWVSERKDLLSGFFFLLTLWAYVRYTRALRGADEPFGAVDAHSPAPATAGLSNERRGKWWYIAALVLFALGLMSKPMLVTLPALLIVLDFWPLKRLDPSAGGGPMPMTRLRLLVAEKFPFFCLAVVVSVITMLAQASGGALVSLQKEGVLNRAGNCLAAYGGYIQSLLWPHDLSVLYLRAATPSAQAVLIGATVLLALSALAIASRRQYPFLCAGWGWFIVLLLPVCGLVQVGLQSIADRYTYLAGIGLALMLVWSVAEFALTNRCAWVCRPLIAMLACVALVVCATSSRSQLAYWRNTQSLMHHALQLDPRNYIAHRNLGVYYARMGQNKAAKFHRACVRELDPSVQQNIETVTLPQPQRSVSIPVAVVTPSS